LIAAAYGWEPSVLRNLTDGEVEYYHQHLPRIEARHHYSVAQLTADFREMFFPRYLDPDPNGEPKEPPRRRKHWQAEELLPPFAWFEEPERISMTVGAAQTLLAVHDRLPRWARAVAPVATAKMLLNASPGPA